MIVGCVELCFCLFGSTPQDSPRVADVTDGPAIVRAAVEMETHSRRCATQGIIDRRVLVQLLTVIWACGIHSNSGSFGMISVGWCWINCSRNVIGKQEVPQQQQQKAENRPPLQRWRLPLWMVAFRSLPQQHRQANTRTQAQRAGNLDVKGDWVCGNLIRRINRNGPIGFPRRVGVSN